MMDKPKNMTPTEARVYDVLMANQTNLSDGFGYYLPSGLLSDMAYIEVGQDAVFHSLIKLIIKAVNDE